MKRRTLLLAFGAAAATPLAAADPALLEQVRQRLATAPVLRGTFEQRKAIRGFKNPLVSRGDYLVARERGVLWRTHEPFASTLVITRERLLARQADGSVSQQMTTREEPGLRAINQTLFALLAADVGELSQRFKIEGALQGAAGWTLVLTPLDAALAQWVTRIALQGDRFVRDVQLTEALGDTTQIRLSGQATAQALSPDDATQFD